ncbi:MAG: hypothetical protein DRR00_17110 [Candidatus Parabeggiatoa sp. nov. 3]|nr:MAG: hypothetical protein DRR00_17110 [Gammaproteobacteria bacterium]
MITNIILNLKKLCKQEKVEIWAYCLRNNHVHRVSNQTRYPIFSKAETLMLYTRMINFREKWIFVAGAFCFMENG